MTYELKNTGATTRDVGLRMVLDTLIGANDGVPFIVPGRDGIVTGPLELSGLAVPDFVRSLERPELERPGVIVDLGLVPAEGQERPARWCSRTGPAPMPPGITTGSPRSRMIRRWACFIRRHPWSPATRARSGSLTGSARSPAPRRGTPV